MITLLIARCDTPSSHPCMMILGITMIKLIQIGKLHILFGKDDGWSPLTYRDNLLRTVPDFPETEAVIDSGNIPHAFVEFNSEVTATIVADWIKKKDN